MTTDLAIFSDYYQLEIVDGDSETIPWDDLYWEDEHMVIAEDAAAIITGVNSYMRVTVEVGDAVPVDDSHAFDTVFEFSLRVDSGRLTVTSPTWGRGRDVDQVPVPRGWLRIRVSLSVSPFDHNDDSELDDPESWRRIRIQCRPGDRADPVLIKG